jgi:hypothetical protein
MRVPGRRRIAPIEWGSAAGEHAKRCAAIVRARLFRGLAGKARREMNLRCKGVEKNFGGVKAIFSARTPRTYRLGDTTWLGAGKMRLGLEDA